MNEVPKKKTLRREVFVGQGHGGRGGARGALPWGHSVAEHLVPLERPLVPGLDGEHRVDDPEGVLLQVHRLHATQRLQVNEGELLQDVPRRLLVGLPVRGEGVGGGGAVACEGGPMRGRHVRRRAHGRAAWDPGHRTPHTRANGGQQ